MISQINPDVESDVMFLNTCSSEIQFDDDNRFPIPTMLLDNESAILNKLNTDALANVSPDKKDQLTTVLASLSSNVTCLEQGNGQALYAIQANLQSICDLLNN